MADQAHQDTSPAQVAANVAIATTVSMAVQLGVLLGAAWAIRNRPLLEARARHLVKVIRRDRSPADAGMRMAEHSADVAAIAHLEVIA